MAKGPFEHIRTVYIALDDSQMAEQISSQITCFGFHDHLFTTKNTFQEAIAIRRPDFIIMDMDFCQKTLNGAKLIEELQQKQKRALPVLFISQNDTLEARLASVRAQGKAFLTTPIDMAQLIEKIQSSTYREQTEPYRILIVEDSRAQAYFVATTLNNAGMITEVVHDPFQLMKTVIDFRPELILMDIYLPKCTGIELANVIRQQDAYVGVPIVFLSSEQDLSRQLHAMMLGGDDFLTKPITPEHLVSAINSRASRSRIIRGYMMRDSLTGLLNHTYLLEQLEIELSRCQRQGLPLCFAMIDIDHFKEVNDTYGHPVGDRVIKSLSHLLSQRLRKTDTIGRYGGEEFAVILPNTDLDSSYRIIEEIRQSFEDLKHYAGETIFRATFSAGIASMQQHSTRLLTETADHALYQAKSSGRNIIHLAAITEENIFSTNCV